MRHWMMRMLVAVVGLAASNSAQAGGGCDNCAPAPVVVQGVGTAANCGDCGPTAKKSLHNKIKNCVGCDTKFIFGSSKSFFAPCNGGCSDLPISLNRGNCPKPIYGSGIGEPAKNCGVYSNLNR